MKDDIEVKIMLTKERYDELRKKEEELEKYKEDNSIILGYKYLDLKSPRTILMTNKDDLELLYKIGDNVPQEFISHTEAIKEQILERLEQLNETRLNKIEAAKVYFKDEIDWRKEQGMQPSWDILEWLGLRKERDAR